MDRRGTPYRITEVESLVMDKGHRIDPYFRTLMVVALNRLDAMQELAMKAGATKEQANGVRNAPDWVADEGYRKYEKKPANSRRLRQSHSHLERTGS
jgi:hypothetical protein